MPFKIGELNKSIEIDIMEKHVRSWGSTGLAGIAYEALLKANNQNHILKMGKMPPLSFCPMPLGVLPRWQNAHFTKKIICLYLEKIQHLSQTDACDSFQYTCLDLPVQIFLAATKQL